MYRSQELMAQTLNALKDRTNLNPLDVEDVIVGCVTAHGEQAMCIARMSVLAAEWPNDSTGVTINRFCGSGHQTRTQKSRYDDQGHRPD